MPIVDFLSISKVVTYGKTVWFMIEAPSCCSVVIGPRSLSPRRSHSLRQMVTACARCSALAPFFLVASAASSEMA
eukprot:4066147-Prymnesium_polylepis.2